VPHNQVERKYREGLNSEIEKLRRAVPTLPQSNDSGVIGQPKPSKAIVVSAAVDYIRRTEKERDTLREEIKRTKHAQSKKR
jgi:acyl-coenzyme A synthetase/AMP-(fatty) acid ligase